MADLAQRVVIDNLSRLRSEFSVDCFNYILSADQVHIWHADIRNGRMLDSSGILSRTELDRAGKYRFEADANRFITARVMLRLALSLYLYREPHDIIFENDLNGKPRSQGEPEDGVQFNVSHSGNKVVIAVVLGKRVGVDIEKVDKTIHCLDLARNYFSSREVAALENVPDEERAKNFCRIWARKESLLKAIGVGLAGLCRSIDLFDSDDVVFRGRQWRLLDLDIAQGYATALAVEGAIGEIQILSGDQFLKAD